MARNNGVDYGIQPTRDQRKVLPPRVFDRASVPKSTDDGIHAFAMLASKHNPPSEWDASTPSHREGFRWYWIFLVVALALTAPYWWPLIAPLLAVAAQ